MNAAQLSHQLRTHQDRWLTNRRRIVGLSFTAAQSMQLMGMYQMGLLRHLPDPPLPGFDADHVGASEQAYRTLRMPDAFLGLASYAVTAGLAAMGGKDRSTTRPWIPILLAGKTALDAAPAAKLAWDQKAKHRSFCFWCPLAAGATFATVPLAMPEAMAASKRIGGRMGLLSGWG